MNVEALFGVPAVAFADPDSALAWLETRVFRVRGWPLDRPTVTAILAAR